MVMFLDTPDLAVVADRLGVGRGYAGELVKGGAHRLMRGCFSDYRVGYEPIFAEVVGLGHWPGIIDIRKNADQFRTLLAGKRTPLHEMWECKIIQLGWSYDRDNETRNEQTINAHGKVGWQLVSYNKNSGTNDSGWSVAFKRKAAALSTPPD